MANFISACFYYGEESLVASVCHQIMFMSLHYFQHEKTSAIILSRVCLEQQKKEGGD